MEKYNEDIKDDVIKKVKYEKAIQEAKIFELEDRELDQKNGIKDYEKKSKVDKIQSN